MSRPAPHGEDVWQGVGWGLAERLGSPGHRDDARHGDERGHTVCGSREIARNVMGGILGQDQLDLCHAYDAVARLPA